MTDPELDRLLKSVHPPGRDADYWTAFPGETARRARTQRSVKERRPMGRRWFVVLAAALPLLLAGVFLLGRVQGRRERIEPAELSAALRIVSELSTLFPGRIEAVVFEPSGPRIVLNESGSAPGRQPLLIKVCSGGVCRTAVTFSGGRLRLGGEDLEVLARGDHDVMVLGRSFGWTTGQPQDVRGLRLAGQVLEDPL